MQPEEGRGGRYQCRGDLIGQLPVLATDKSHAECKLWPSGMSCILCMICHQTTMRKRGLMPGNDERMSGLDTLGGLHATHGICPVLT